MEEFNWPYPESDSAYPGLLYPGDGSSAGPDTTSTWQHMLREAKAEPSDEERPDAEVDSNRWAEQRPASRLP